MVTPDDTIATVASNVPAVPAHAAALNSLTAALSSGATPVQALTAMAQSAGIPLDHPVVQAALTAITKPAPQAAPVAAVLRPVTSATQHAQNMATAQRLLGATQQAVVTPLPRKRHDTTPRHGEFAAITLK
jgi:hypothetical protein